MKILTEDQNSEQEIDHKPLYAHARKSIPTRPDSQKCDVDNNPDEENTEEQSSVFHKVSSMYMAPAIGFAQ